MQAPETFRLLNAWQRGFPLTQRPFADIAAQCGLTEEQVLDRYAMLRNEGLMDRIGPVFRPNTVGASTLAAMAVPPARLEEVADLVTGCEGVNHNYEREHRFNLWFVVTGASADEVEQTLQRIERQTRLAVLRLPLIEEYHIDLGFDLEDLSVPRAAQQETPKPVLLSAEEKRLLKALAQGLPLVSRPYATLAQASGLSEAAVIALLQAWLDGGIVRRFGTVVRHRRLGFEANAMVVWDVPDAEVPALGRLAAAERAVTLCYRRARVLPEWPYNLYCMLHGQKRERVLADIARLGASTGLERFTCLVLFSRRCFAQRGARYAAGLTHA